MLTRRDFLRGLILSAVAGALVKNGVPQPEQVIGVDWAAEGADRSVATVFDMAANTWRQKPYVVIPVWVNPADGEPLLVEKWRYGYFSQIKIARRYCVGKNADGWARRQIGADLDKGESVPNWAVEFAFRQPYDFYLDPPLPSRDVATRYCRLRKTILNSEKAYMQAVLDVAREKLGC